MAPTIVESLLVGTLNYSIPLTTADVDVTIDSTNNYNNYNNHHADHGYYNNLDGQAVGHSFNASLYPRPAAGFYQSRRMSSLERFSNEYMELHGVVSLAVCALGIPMNVLNVFVLKRLRVQTPVNTILTWLAVFDLLTMICYLPFSLHFYCFESTFSTSPQRNSLGWMTFLIFHIDFTSTTHTISNWLAVILAMFRYRHLFSPAKGDLTRMRRLVRARLAVFSVVIMSIITMIPNFLMNRLVGIKGTDSETNETGVIYSLEQLNLGTPQVKVLAQINLWVYSTLAKILPCCLMVVYSGLLLKTLRKNVRMISCQPRVIQGSIEYSTAADEQGTSNSIRSYVTSFVESRQRKGGGGLMCFLFGKKANQSQASGGVNVTAACRVTVEPPKKKKSRRPRDNARTTRMLLTIIVLYVVTELPQAFLIILSASTPNFFTDVYIPLGDIIDLLALLNNGINFFLYCTMSREFRKTLVSFIKGSNSCYSVCKAKTLNKGTPLPAKNANVNEICPVDCSQLLNTRSSQSRKTDSVLTKTSS